MLSTFAIPSPGDGTNVVTEMPEVILVDVSDPNEINEVFSPALVVEIIDHRAIHFAKNFPNAKKVQIELVGSCATLVAERLQAAEHTPSRNAARLLYGAIVSNTVNFQSANTTERDHAMAAWLRPLAELPKNFVRDMFVAKSNLAGDELRKALIGDYILKEFGGKCIGIFQLEVVNVDALLDERVGEIEHLMREMNEKERFDYVMLNGVDTLAGTCTLLVFDDTSRELAERALGRSFVGNRSRLERIEIRKQLTVKLRAYLEGQG